MKKLLSVLLAATTALTVCGGLAACGDKDNGPKNDYKIVVWAPNASIAQYKAYVENATTGFKAKYPDYANYTISFEAKEEGDTQAAVVKDAQEAAEVFFFPSDHLRNLRQANVVQPLTDTYATAVKARDIQSTVDFVTENNQIYAFPTTDDNGYFLWYDKTFFSADDVKSLDTMQSKAKAAGKHILFDFANSYYSPSFFIGLGCTFGYKSDGTYEAQLTTAEGYAAGNAYLEYAKASKNGTIAAGDTEGETNTDGLTLVTGNLAEGLADGTFVAGISGTWEYTSIQQALAGSKNTSGKTMDDIETAALPKFKYTLNGQQKEEYMGAFVGGKYCGVNRRKTTEEIEVSLALADFLTNEDGQKVRFNAQASGPSNKNVAALDNVKNHLALKGYNAQKATGKVLIQGAQSDAFWGDSGIKNFTQMVFIQNSNYQTEAQVKSALDALANGLNK